MAWTKMKSVIAVSVGVLLAAGTTTLTVIEIQKHRTYSWQDMVDGGQQALNALDTTRPQVTIVRSKFGAGYRHNRLIDDIVGRFDLLAEQPRMGRARPEFGAGVRSFAVENYVIYYRHDGDVLIARILHGRRDQIAA